MSKKNKRPAILDHIEQVYGFSVFDGPENYDLNIIGVRNPESEPDKYDDTLVVCYKSRGQWKEERFPCTTDPGLFWLKNSKRNSGGCAIVKHPQQMKGAYEIGLHRGKYSCLKQKKPVEFWRSDSLPVEFWRPDYTGEQYTGPVYSGVIGVNIHRSSAYRDTTSESIGQYSAGCTVLSNPKDLKRLLYLCRKQTEHNPGWFRFTYTLILGEG